MPRSRPLLLTCAFVMLVSGCDRQSAPPAQPQETATPSAATTQLTGKLDRGSAGKAMPAGSVSKADGTQLSLASLKGKPVLLNLWATWCAPCVVEMPLLDKLAADMDGKVTVLTVSEDFKPELVPPFFAQKGFKALPQWVDPSNKLALEYGGAALPLTVLYDKNGKEVWRVMGGYDWSGAEARKAVQDALG